MRRYILLFIIAAVITCQSAAFANAAEPPSLIVIIPDDTTVLLVNSDDEPDLTAVEALVTSDAFLSDSEAYDESGHLSVTSGNQRKAAWENYTAFYRHEFLDSNASLYVDTAEDHFLITLPPELLNHYNSIVTLDVATRSITEGKLPSRNALLISLRVMLTLLLEGAAFWLFGFRTRRSWIGFLIINLITQGTLNYLLSMFSPYNGYAIFGLVYYEFWIIIVESFAFGLFIREHRALRRILYAIVANLASLVLGGYLILTLPV
ncbi:hypothetical protein KHM83_01795 [Fusibacter paucivorans]|uniref:Uncharacterized protein n=1 Tax=Fusibacter paucivorans TaxID=76009 RepID=A0ABS5PJS5_9FIRM|nr:hypothetical protein [Fusibacter paucivorans]MBS7525405.1 hypothetical protein [Fusibacter paucivorans]